MRRRYRMKVEERKRLLVEMAPQLDLSKPLQMQDAWWQARSSVCAAIPRTHQGRLFQENEAKRKLKMIQRKMNDPDPKCEHCFKGAKQAR